MTLCIAAIAGNGKGIVTASDMRYDLGHTSGDGRPKFGRIHPHWAAMFAGEDVTKAPNVLRNIVEAMSGAPNASHRQVEKLFRDEIRAALREDIEAEVLSPFNLTVDEFTRTGSKRFPPDVFADIAVRMQHASVKYEFLVFGFDEKQEPQMFRARQSGSEDCRTFGFWAIGSGDTAAVHHMMFQEYKTSLPLRTAAYYVCAAKFFAERASLGEATHVVCLMKDGRVIGIDEKKIRALWETEGRPKIPSDVWNKLPAFKGIVGDLNTTDDQNVQLPQIEPLKIGDWISVRLTGQEVKGSSGTLKPSVTYPTDPEGPPAPKVPRGKK